MLSIYGNNTFLSNYAVFRIFIERNLCIYYCTYLWLRGLELYDSDSRGEGFLLELFQKICEMKSEKVSKSQLWAYADANSSEEIYFQKRMQNT